MSELKARGTDDVYIEYYNTGKHELAQVYLKSEADKVIAHHKYKRCLAMAKWCAAECVVNQDTYKRYSTHKSEFRIGHLRKWRKRWLELAEKFKEAK